MSTAEQITDPCAGHGEGPVWDSHSQRVSWVDMFAGEILTLDSSGEVTRRRVGSFCASFQFRTLGGLVVATERGFALVGTEAGAPEPVCEIWDDPRVRMNDGGCDPQGRFYCGSMSSGRRGHGVLYRLDPDRSVHVVLDSVSVSNGLAWSVDGSTVYYVDTPTQQIDAFDFEPDSGRFSGRRRLVAIDAIDGSPDGICVDSEGCIWVATWTGHSIRRYSPDGRLQDVVSLPVTRVTSCAFGGPELTDLFVTTSRLGLASGEEDPHGGALFVLHTGVRGLPTTAFAG
jgi:sugar lactone lactonase YvrE